MSLDLSALDQPLSTFGKPLQLRLSDIDEDPDQPRKVFTPDALARMAESIRRRGVRSPVSVRPHPTEPGRFMLNHGARRFRGSAIAGKVTIPAILDETHTDYDQVIENLQRDDLKPMELAEFIGRKLRAGDKKARIARYLGIDASVVTQHLALIDPPACIEVVYTSGRCQSPKTLYELRALHEAFPDAVALWCEKETEITRRTVSALGNRLRSEQSLPSISSTHIARSTSSPGEPATTRTKPSPRDIDLTSITTVSPFPECEVWLSIDGRSAQLVLDRQPSDLDCVYVRYEGIIGEETVRAEACLLRGVRTASDASLAPCGER